MPWLMPLIPALEKQKQADFCELEANLVFIESSRTVRATERKRVSKEKKVISRYLSDTGRHM